MADPDPQLEAVKIAGDWNKQVSLWATGAVVLSVTFMQDLLKGVDLTWGWRAELISAWMFLVSSTVFGLLAYGAPITGAGQANFHPAVNRPTRVLSIVQASLFCGGILGLVLFAFFTLPGRLTADQTASHSSTSASAAHFVISRSTGVMTTHGKTHRHTFLVDESTGAVWEMVCARDGVRFRRVSVEGMPPK